MLRQPPHSGRRVPRRTAHPAAGALWVVSGLAPACTLTEDVLHPESAVIPGSGGSSSAQCEPSSNGCDGAEIRDVPAEAPNPEVLAPQAPDGGAPPSASVAPDDAGLSFAGDGGAAELDLRPLNDVIGWAGVGGAGVPTTSGGLGGGVALATSGSELAELLARPDPLTILLAGTIRLGSAEVSSNKTLVGIGAATKLEGGLRIRGTAETFVQNVIVYNLRVDAAFSEVGGDGIQIHYAHHVWIDHCEVRDAADGAIDVVHGSDFVTISWTKFLYSAAPAPGAGLATLIGHSDDAAAEDSGHLRVTLHHNWWADFASADMPRVRFGDVHVFNNYYSSAGNTTTIVAGTSARVLVERNYFDAVTAPHAFLPAVGAQLLALENVYAGTSGSQASSGAAFAPPYIYVADPAADVLGVVMAGAGPRF